MLKNSENNGTEEIGLVTPTPGLLVNANFTGRDICHTTEIIHSEQHSLKHCHTQKADGTACPNELRHIWVRPY